MYIFINFNLGNYLNDLQITQDPCGDVSASDEDIQIQLKLWRNNMYIYLLCIYVFKCTYVYVCIYKLSSNFSLI